VYSFVTRAFFWLAAIIALTFSWIAFDEMQYDSTGRPHQFMSVLVALAIAVLFGIAAASAWFRWRTLRPAAFLCGGSAALYAISVLTRSTGEVSGVSASLLLSVSVITAALALTVGIRRTGL
jgi:hypothetical protein